MPRRDAEAAVYSWGDDLVLMDVREKLSGLAGGAVAEMALGAGEWERVSGSLRDRGWALVERMLPGDTGGRLMRLHRA